MTLRFQDLRTVTAGGIALLHYSLIPVMLLAWMVPSSTVLIAHLIAVPLLVLQWRLNGDVCLLNNVESWLRRGRWRDKADPDQGQWIRGIVARLTGIQLGPRGVSILVNSLLALSWSFSWVHLARLEGWHT